MFHFCIAIYYVTVSILPVFVKKRKESRTLIFMWEVRKMIPQMVAVLRDTAIPSPLAFSEHYIACSHSTQILHHIHGKILKYHKRAKL